MSLAEKKQRLTIVCENYWPEVAATAQLITDLAEALARDFVVEVLTAQPRYHGAYKRRPALEVRNGVLVRRLRVSRFDKNRPIGRLINWLTFLVSTSVAVATRWRRRTYLFVTNPPTAPWAAVIACWLRHPAYVLVHDLYPDLAVAVGAVRRDSTAAKGFDIVNKLAFRRATGLIALGQDMRDRLTEKLGPAVAVEVISNWADPVLISPSEKRTSEFARRHQLTDRFVFLYAGNLGLFQDLETLIHAIESLEGASDSAALVFVGDGGKRSLLETMALRSRRTRVFDYVPYEELGDMYAAADVGVIALEPGVEKTNVPSKTYSIMAAGRPFLAVCQNSTDLRALAEAGCGVVVGNDTAGVAAAMARFIADVDSARAMGRRGREMFLQDYAKAVVIDKYRKLFRIGGTT